MGSTPGFGPGDPGSSPGPPAISRPTIRGAGRIFGQLRDRALGRHAAGLHCPAMRAPFLAVATLAACLLPAAPAAAGDPIMPLSEVRSGMQCTGYSVIRGTDISAFDVEVIDVVDSEPGTGTAMILVEASGPAVDRTGIGPGFSGSPVYCGGRTHRSDLAVDRGLRRQGGAGDADRVHAREPGRRPAAPRDDPLGTRGRGDQAHAPRGHEAARRSAHDQRRPSRPWPGARAGRQAHRPTGHRGARGPAGQLPAADPPARLGRSGGLFERGPARLRGRHRRVHRRRPRVGLRPPVRERRRALPASPGRLHLQGHQRPQRVAHGRLVQARLRRP